MKKVVLCLVFGLMVLPRAQAASLTSVCEELLAWSAKGYVLWNYTLPLNLHSLSPAAYNSKMLLRDATWAAIDKQNSFQKQVVYADVHQAYPESRVALLKFPAELYTAQGTRVRFAAGSLVLLKEGLVHLQIQRLTEPEIEKQFIRFVRMHHHFLNGSAEYIEDDGRSQPIDTALLKFVTERYARLTGQEFPTVQVHMSVVHGTRDPIVLKLLRKYTQIERSDFAP